MVVRWVAVLAVAGCDWAFGVPVFNHEPDASNDLAVHGTYRQHWLENDALGHPVPQDTAPKLADVATSRVVLDDGAVRPLTFNDDGTFSFTIETAGQRYALEIVTPSSDTVYELDSSQLALVERYSGRIDRQPVVNSTAVLIKVTGQTVNHPTTKEELHTTGIWDGRPSLGYTVANNTFTVDWATIPGIGGPMPLLDGSRHDAMYYAHYTNIGTETRLDVTAPVANATITDGATNSFTATPAPVPAPNCVHLTAAIGAEAARLSALHSSVNPFQAWLVSSHPADEFAATTRYPLAYALSADTLDVQASYGNPYPNTLVDAEILIGVYVGADGALLATDTIVPVLPGNCAAPPLVGFVLGGAGIPDDVMLGTTSLFANGPALVIDHSMPVTVSWTTAAGGASYYVVKLQEVLATTPFVRTRDLVTVVTTKQSATIDAKHFTTFPTYRIEIVAMSGYPEAASGDFSRSSVSTATAAVDTVMFKTQ